MIVKVQLSLYSSIGVRTVLVTSKDDTLYFGPVPASIVQRMAGSAREYFEAEIVNGFIVLGEIAPRQKW